eukprot:3764118-Rhodomonas_salina.1
MSNQITACLLKQSAQKLLIILLAHLQTVATRHTDCGAMVVRFLVKHEAYSTIHALVFLASETVFNIAHSQSATYFIVSMDSRTSEPISPFNADLTECINVISNQSFFRTNANMCGRLGEYFDNFTTRVVQYPHGSPEWKEVYKT